MVSCRTGRGRGSPVRRTANALPADALDQQNGPRERIHITAWTGEVEQLQRLGRAGDAPFQQRENLQIAAACRTVEDRADLLRDLAYARAGGTLVLWRSGTRGADAVGPQRVFASFRRAGSADFGAPDAVSDSSVIPAAPAAAVNPLTGASAAAFGYLTPTSVPVSVRGLAGGTT